jgi:hypothetical protein
MSLNLEYGYIIQLNSSTKTDYEDKYFFVEKITETELSLLTQDGEKLSLSGSLKENDIDSISVVLIPENENKGFIRHNKLRPNKWVEVIFEENDIIEKFQGKILSIDNDIIEIEGEQKTIYIPVENGLPKLVSSIQQIPQPRHTMFKPSPYEKEPPPTTREKPKLPDEIKEILDNAVEGEVIGYVDEDLDSNQIELFYTIEQQKLDLLEHLLIGVDESKRTSKLMRQFHNVIRRFTELRSKYTKFNKRIEINRLPSDQFLHSISTNTNPYFSPLSNNRVHLKQLLQNIFITDFGDNSLFEKKEGFLENGDAEADYALPSYYELIEPEVVIDESGYSKNDPKEQALYNMNIQDYFRLKNKVVENFITTIGNVTENEHFENLSVPIKIYLQLEEVHPVRIFQPYVFNSYVTQPLSSIETIKTTFRGSTILEKANLSRLPYYETIFRLPDKEDSVRHVTVGPNYKPSKKCNLFDKNRLTVFNNQCDTFSTFVSKMMPSFEEYIDCYLNPYFISYTQAIKQLESLDIHEMNEPTYKIIHSILKKNISELRNLENKQRKMNLHKRNIGTIYTIKNKINDRFTTNYIELKDNVTYYSSSELYKYGLIDSYRFYSLQYLIDHQPLLQSINDGTMQTLMEQIKQEFDNPQEIERIHKIYQKEQQRINDNNKPIIFQDVLWEGKPISITDYLHLMIIKNGYNYTIDDIREKMGKIVEKGLDQVDVEFPPDMVAFIKEILTQYKIMPNQIAEVIETRKKYFWDGNQWIDLKEQGDYTKRKLVSVKGKDLNIKKDNEFKKRVVDMIQDFEISKRRQLEIEKIEMQDTKHLKKLRSLQHQKLLKDMQYHNERYEYMMIELQKETSGVTVSPHEELKQKILKEYVPLNRYTLIQKFVNKYTKSGEDPYWYYCIDTGVKLLPTFYFELANAFLLYNNYKETLTRISNLRGTIGDNGDYIVDKHSGYPIMKIDFDEDEDYNADGFKDKFHAIIEPDVLETNKLESEEKILDKNEELIYNAVDFFFHSMGIVVEETDIMTVTNFVVQSSKQANRGRTKEDEINQGIVYSIISHCLLYVQTTIETKLKYTHPFPGCSKSFEGFPLVADDTTYTGIKYLCCIVTKIAKPSAPWSSMKSVRLEKMIEITVKFIQKFIITSFTFESMLNEKRNHIKIVSEIEIPPESNWSNFNPRLKPIRPIMHNIPHNDDDKIMLYSFMIQNHINEHISKQTALLINNSQKPEIVNACCDKNNNVHEYMLEHTNIRKELQSIVETKRNNKKNKYFSLNHMYSPRPTNFARPMLSVALSENTIYIGIIKWFEMDTNQLIPEYLKNRFQNIFKPDEYDRNDSLKEKIKVLKESNIIVNEELFYDILKTISSKKIIKPRVLSQSEIEESEPVYDNTNTIDQMLMDNKLEDLYNLCGEEVSQASLTKILASYRDTPMNKKQLEKCLKFNTQFESEKNNDIIPAEIEHYNFMNQILYNKIHQLIYTNPEKIKTGYKPNTIVPKHWGLHGFHTAMVKEYVSNYYSGIEKYYQDENMSKVLDLVDTGKYKRWLKHPIKNQKYKNIFYYYIFVSIFKDYIALDNQMMNKYIGIIATFFAEEDRTALNFSKKRIDFETSAAKKSEVEIKTEALGKLQKDARKAQNIMKELKLGEWSVGLGKSLFEYDPTVFMDVYKEATDIESRRAKYMPEDSSNFDPNIGHDDGDVPEEINDMYG